MFYDFGLKCFIPCLYGFKSFFTTLTTKLFDTLTVRRRALDSVV